MHILGIPILSLLIFFPLAGAVILLFINKEKANTLRGVAFVFSLVEFILSLPLFFAFDSTTASMQFVEDWWWVQDYGISYKLGIDGISLLLVLLTTFLNRPLHLEFLEGDHLPGEGIHDLISLPRDRDDRCVGGSGSRPVLCLLGDDAHPHVPPHRHLG